MAVNSLAFPKTYQRNVFVFAINSQTHGPSKYLIATNDAITQNEFEKICKKHITDHDAAKSDMNIITYICEQTGWFICNYYNNNDYSYQTIDA